MEDRVTLEDIIDVLPKGVPQSPWIAWVAVLENSEKETQKKALSRRRVSIIHSANLIAPLPNSPDICVLVPDHLVGKVLIEGIVDNAIPVKSIGFEPPSKSGVPVLMSLKSLLKGVPFRVNDNCLLLRKVDHKTHDTGLMILNLKEVKTPVCLTA